MPIVAPEDRPLILLVHACHAVALAKAGNLALNSVAIAQGARVSVSVRSKELSRPLIDLDIVQPNSVPGIELQLNG